MKYIAIKSMLALLLACSSCNKINETQKNEKQKTEKKVNTLSDDEIIKYAKKISEGTVCHIAVCVQPNEQIGACRVLIPNPEATFTLIITDLEQSTNNVTTGKQKNIVGSEMNGYLGKPSVTIPIITNDTVAKAVFLHEELHTRQQKNLSSPQRELDAYIAEGEYLKKVIGKKYIDFIKKTSQIYKKNGIGEELFKATDQLFPDAPRLEKDIIRPVLMFLSAIEAGENTEEKFNKILIDTSKFFKDNDHTQYQIKQP